MPGLVPGIHALANHQRCKVVDGRDPMSGLPDIGKLNAQVG
jgi:hypothetical protein